MLSWMIVMGTNDGSGECIFDRQDIIIRIPIGRSCL